ncbi:four-carbon acid sugar kinase family protein [Kocuria flava]|uniref:4-hydroxythreonine-4-phosphate dehydrogenase n=1 Tax=Kocuria flava TaxID=446860 RepID=A0A2N4T0E0_9MICC|nr:four-carbon acid sugar kinase family protein [Kocuria flava]PLC11656.1 hypothetical protein AUQ48_04625 [Kocuria flava]
MADVEVLALADDLSGANEVAAVLGGLRDRSAPGARPEQPGRARATSVRLDAASLRLQEPGPGVVVGVTDNRRRTAEEAAAHLARVLGEAVTARPDAVLLKFDSLLRGHVGAQLAAARRLAPVLFCPAVPALGRTVRDGVLRVDGVPLHEGSLWAAEPAPPAGSVPAQLAPAPVRHLDLRTVRGPGLDQALLRAAEGGAVAVADAETAGDLDRLAAAGMRQGHVLAGASGIAAALASRLPADAPGEGRARTPHVTPQDILVVLGTASAAGRRQAAALAAEGVPVHRLRPEQLAGFPLGTGGTVAVTVEAAVDPAISAAVNAALTALTVRAHGGRHLVLSGGETAHAVLDALGITELTPLAQAHPGAVVAATADGRLVTTRPGSYGSDTSLLEILSTVHALQDTTRKVPS